MLEFYQTFQHLFAQRWHRASSLLDDFGRHNLESPKLWKSAGDELIYSQLITDSYQACFAVRAWIDAAKLFREELRNKFPSLDVKMTAWVAGFPVINTEIVLETDPSKVFSQNNIIQSNMLTSMFCKLNDYYAEQNPDKIKPFLDFIGPSMDIGFRLCSLSSQRQMPVSVELAFILSSVRKHLIHNIKQNAQTDAELLDKLNEFSEPKLRYMGRKELKGVLNGRMYPIFWLDTAMDNALEMAEDAIIKRHDMTSDQCIDLINAFINDINNPFLVCQPYIDKDIGNVLPSKKHAEHKILVQAWFEAWEKDFNNSTQFENETSKAETPIDSNNNETDPPDDFDLSLEHDALRAKSQKQDLGG